MRILLVEDDEPIAQALVATLSAQNYVVDVATDGQTGWELVEACAYDLILLDLMLPKMDGISLCRRVRSQGYRMPILLLTAKDSTADKVMGLDAGADDYVVKPCELQELTARIRALLRRVDSTLPPVLEWGSLHLDPSNCEVTYASKPLHLTPTEYRLLELFLRNSQRVFSRSAILDHLWSFEEPPAEDTIRAHIKGLRQKLKAAGAPTDLIETVYGLGYRLKPLPSHEKYQGPPRILMAGLPKELATWLERRLGSVSLRVPHSGEETINELAQNHWSLLILDPDGIGAAAGEAIAKARIKGVLAQVPTIYCLEKGVRSIPAKLSGQRLFHPIDREELALKVAQVLELDLRPGGSNNTSDRTGEVPLLHEQTQAAVAQVWERFKDRISDRVTVLEQATKALYCGTLNDELRTCAKQEAHKLAGSLGTFGFTHGSELAKEIEHLLHGEKVGKYQWLHLEELVGSLRRELQTTPAKKEPALSPPSKNGEQLPLLLVVDADTELTEQLILEAKRWGMQACIAQNLSAARKAIAQRRPDVVLLDLALPGTDSTNGLLKRDGLTLLAELANQVPPLPVLVFTVEGGVQDRLEVARLGGRAFLQKPVPPTQAIEAVTQVLQRADKTEAKVMVVDDDPQILAILRTFLEPWGLRAIALGDPKRFWETLELSAPDLLILDVEMPHLSGIELCQVVRNDPRWSGMPVIFLTALTDADTIHRVFAAGADDYVSKPIVGPELVTRILNRLERTQMLRTMAETDPLTGVANRRRSCQDFSHFFHLAERHRQPLSFAILDLDRFKDVNDQHGHATGDAVLRRLGKLLLRTFRSEDVVARWGGEEFVVGMYGMTKLDAIKRLTEVAMAWGEEAFAGTNGTPFQVTFSAGVAEYPNDGADLQFLYRAADAALYRAKAAGRDRVLPAL